MGYDERHGKPTGIGEFIAAGLRILVAQPGMYPVGIAKGLARLTGYIRAIIVEGNNTALQYRSPT